MADYSSTAASVLASTGATPRSGVAGATIVQGNVLYKDATDGSLKLADANSGTAAARTPIGIATNAASAGQPVSYIIQDPAFAPGFTIAVGAVVVLSATPGAMAPIDDLTTGDYAVVIGIGIIGNKMNIQGFGLVSGAAIP